MYKNYIFDRGVLDLDQTKCLLGFLGVIGAKEAVFW
jgi:hypothetical protein